MANKCTRQSLYTFLLCCKRPFFGRWDVGKFLGNGSTSLFVLSSCGVIKANMGTQEPCGTWCLPLDLTSSEFSGFPALTTPSSKTSIAVKTRNDTIYWPLVLIFVHKSRIDRAVQCLFTIITCSVICGYELTTLRTT